MSGPRYVVLGLAPVRATWFRTVAQWANASSVPIEFVKCLSGEELRARLGSGRTFSAVMVDANLPAVDRDLLDAGSQAGCAVLVVEDRRPRRDWVSLGAHAVVVGTLERAELLDVLRQHARPVATSDPVERLGLAGGGAGDQGGASLGRVVTLCGAGGTGTSTLAMATAQGLAGLVRGGDGGPPRGHRPPPREHGVPPPESAGGRPPVVLADLARHAEQAVLHDACDVVPGIQELVDAHRGGRLGPDEVVSLTFGVPERGYHLLLGLRRASAWASLRPRAFEAAFASLCDTYETVVCDVEADLEGEHDGGSSDVEERNLMARTAVGRADVVLAVGLPGVKGLHSLMRVTGELVSAGVPPGRILAVVNRAPRSHRVRAELAQAFAQLTAGAGTAAATPLFLPERRLDEVSGHAQRLPGALAEPLAAAVGAVLDRAGPRATEPDQHASPRPVIPGSLGHWEDDEAAMG